MTEELDWKRLSLEEREREYSPSSCIGGDHQPHIRDYAKLSAAARQRRVPATIRYGAGPSQAMDLFLPEATGGKPPVVVFFHGGYWQELAKEDSAFAAPHCLAQDIAYAAVGYTLARGNRAQR